MTIDLEQSTAGGRRALRTARRRAGRVVDQARALEVPTVSDLGHRLDQVPAVLEHAVDRQIRAAKRTGRKARRAGLVPTPSLHPGTLHSGASRSGRRNAWRATGIVLALGLCVAAVVVASKQRRAKVAAETPDPFGSAVRDAEEARRAASSAVRA